MGREHVDKMLASIGETSIKIDEIVLDTNFRLAFNDIDYQPQTNTLELTEDKVKSLKISSDGLVAPDVGRTLQYKSKSTLIQIKRILAPFMNFYGFTWLFTFFTSQILPMDFNENKGMMISGICNIVVSIIFGIMGTSILLKISLDLDAYRRGVSAIKKTGIFLHT
ncbi:MAG: zinc metallopeptidase [bacterium]